MPATSNRYAVRSTYDAALAPRKPARPHPRFRTHALGVKKIAHLLEARRDSKFSRRALTETFYAWADKIANDKQHAHRCAVAARFLRAIQQRSLFCAFNRWLVQTNNAI